MKQRDFLKKRLEAILLIEAGSCHRRIEPPPPLPNRSLKKPQPSPNGKSKLQEKSHSKR